MEARPVITLPTGVQWISPTLGLLIVEGDYSTDGGERALQRMQRLNMPQGSDKLGRPYHQVTGHPMLAPQAWAQYDKPCETCKGSRGVIVAEWHGVRHPARCPNCSNGRQSWAMWCPLPCECACHKGIMSRTTASNDCGCRLSRDERQVQGSIEVVPVVEVVETASSDEWPQHTHVRVYPGISAYLMIWTGDGLAPYKLPLDPLPVPGRDWGIVIDCVEVAS